MRHRSLVVHSLLAASALVGCGAGPLEPIDPGEVQITLAVSGGFAGMSFSFAVDGATLEVRGLLCESFCDWEPDELILPVSADQVADLAARLESAGVLDLAGDYGDECCDQFHYDLTYLRDGRMARVQGAQSRLPRGLAEAISHLSSLGFRRLPMLVEHASQEGDWPRDAYTLGVVEASGRSLTAEMTWSGGCGAHRVDLVAWGGWMESSPVQVRALLTHDDGDDPCDAIITEERIFDLSPLANAWVEAYGSPNGPIRVILQLWDPLSASPVGRLIELEM